jgi:hypothetical protein
MNVRKQHVTGLTFAALFLATGSLVLAQEQKPFSPALEQLRETVSERLQTVADKLGLTPEQHEDPRGPRRLRGQIRGPADSAPGVASVGVRSHP